MTLRKVLNGQKTQKAALENERAQTYRRKFRCAEGKRNIPRARTVLHLVLSLFALVFACNVPRQYKYGCLSIFSVSIAAIIEFALKLKKFKETPQCTRQLLKRISWTLKCSTITLLNVQLYLKHGAGAEVRNVLLGVPAIFIYLVLWRTSKYILLDLFFPFTCLTMMYSCYLTSNIFAAMAAMLNAWAYYVRANFKVINELVHSMDIYNLLMCLYAWCSYEGLKFEMPQ